MEEEDTRRSGDGGQERHQPMLSDEDREPESMSSNTTSRGSSRHNSTRAASAHSPLDEDNDNDENENDSDSDMSDAESDNASNSDDHDEEEPSFGKRKADDFLRRQELAMDPRFKSTVVLPGDDVTEATTRTTRSIRLGPGLVRQGETVVATRAGMLRYRPPCTHWVESNGRRYGARVEDQVLGIVEDRMGEAYKVNVFGR